jgi:glyoxylase-like metal-dependent hydrolase (beta-lactamase superfamily II)
MSTSKSSFTVVAAAVLATSLLAAPSAQAQSKLQTQVFTASPGGFLVTSTLVTGEKDAILIDGQFTLSDAHRLVAMILESKKNLTTVYVTHGHPDHYFGLVVLKQAFPSAKLVALPATVAEIKKTWQGKVKQWGPMYGANLTSKPVLPTALKTTAGGVTLTLEGETLEIHGPVQGDDAGNSYVWIPGLKTAVVGDIAYRGMHVWTAETKSESRKAWMKTLDEVTALNPTTVIPGHKDPKYKDEPVVLQQTKDYLKVFDDAAAASKTSAELQSKVKAKYPDLQMDIVLQLGADAAIPAAPAAAPAAAPKK